MKISGFLIVYCPVCEIFIANSILCPNLFGFESKNEDTYVLLSEYCQTYNSALRYQG